MDIVQQKIGDVKVLSLRGRLDVTAKPEFEALLKSAIESGEHKIVLECRELKFVSSSGLGAFIACGRLLTGKGSLVFAEMSDHLQSLFVMTGIDKLFTICKTQQDALDRLTA
jgi:anti-sigma B factor antagonist